MPSAVQWDVVYSTTDITAVVVAAGPTATAANKSVSCNSGTGSTRCVLWGLDSATIANGVLATVTVTLSGTTVNPSTSVQIANVVASAPDGTSIPASATFDHSNNVAVLKRSFPLVIRCFGLAPRQLGWPTP